MRVSFINFTLRIKFTASIFKFKYFSEILRKRKEKKKENGVTDFLIKEFV